GRSGSAETRLGQGRQSAVVSAPPSWASTATSASARPAAMTPYSIARLSASFLENNWTNRFIRTSPRNYPTRAYRSHRQIWWRRPLAARKSLRKLCARVNEELRPALRRGRALAFARRLARRE